MEKIQSAIAKARAAREAQGTAQSSGQPSAEAAPGTGTKVPGTAAITSADAAWLLLKDHVPKASLLKRNRIVTTGEVQEGTAQFDILRTKVLQQMRAQGWRRLAITSPTPSCGKTTTALNLAYSLARQSDLRVVLCEMDLRRPALARLLGIQGERDFVATLRGEADFASQAVRIGHNLAVGVNRQTVRNASELLQSASVIEAIAMIEAQYKPSVILFDMSPLMVSDDVMAFVGQTDCALLVAAAGTTTISQIDTCERDLASQTNVLGVVMNKVRYLEADAGYETYN
jgi:Mrp family chromosome partitioning ATPase